MRRLSLSLCHNRERERRRELEREREREAHHHLLSSNANGHIDRREGSATPTAEKCRVLLLTYTQTMHMVLYPPVCFSILHTYLHTGTVSWRNRLRTGDCDGRLPGETGRQPPKKCTLLCCFKYCTVSCFPHSNITVTMVVGVITLISPHSSSERILAPAPNLPPTVLMTSYCTYKNFSLSLREIGLFFAIVWWW